MQPVGDSFRRRLRTFPSIVNCTTIDWFHQWPKEALYSTAFNYFTTNFQQELSSHDIKNISTVTVSLH